MKKNNHCPQFYLILVLIIIIFNQKIFSQSKEEIIVNKPVNFEQQLGEKIRISLLNNCSVLVGIIKSFRDNKVEFIVQEKVLGGESVAKTLELTYKKPIPKLQIRNELYSPWSFVKTQEGNELIVFYCQGQSDLREYGLIVSDKQYFSSIRKSVLQYIKYKQKPETILDVPKLIKPNEDKIFTSFIISFLRYNGVSEFNNAAFVLTELLEKNYISTFDFAYFYIALRNLLTSSDQLAPTVRDKVLNRLIDLAAGNKKTAEQAMTILIWFVEQPKINLQPYLNKQKKKMLLQNYKKFKIKSTPKTLEKFEKLLMIN
jgi:hypothetical protein